MRQDVTIIEFTITSAFQEQMLRETLLSGTLGLMTPDGSYIRIPPQNITAIPAPINQSDPKQIYIVVGSVVGGIVVVVTLFVTVVVVVKYGKKAAGDKTRHIEASDNSSTDVMNSKRPHCQQATCCYSGWIGSFSPGLSSPSVH
jgi:hypothetical protein